MDLLCDRICRKGNPFLDVPWHFRKDGEKFPGGHFTNRAVAFKRSALLIPMVRRATHIWGTSFCRVLVHGHGNRKRNTNTTNYTLLCSLSNGQKLTGGGECFLFHHKQHVKLSIRYSCHADECAARRARCEAGAARVSRELADGQVAVLLLVGGSEDVHVKGILMMFHVPSAGTRVKWFVTTTESLLGAARATRVRAVRPGLPCVPSCLRTVAGGRGSGGGLKSTDKKMK